MAQATFSIRIDDETLKRQCSLCGLRNKMSQPHSMYLHGLPSWKKNSIWNSDFWGSDQSLQHASLSYSAGWGKEKWCSGFELRWNQWRNQTGTVSICQTAGAIDSPEKLIALGLAKQDFLKEKLKQEYPPSSLFGKFIHIRRLNSKFLYTLTLCYLYCCNSDNDRLIKCNCFIYLNENENNQDFSLARQNKFDAFILKHGNCLPTRFKV